MREDFKSQCLITESDIVIISKSHYRFLHCKELDLSSGDRHRDHTIPARRLPDLFQCLVKQSMDLLVRTILQRLIHFHNSHQTTRITLIKVQTRLMTSASMIMFAFLQRFDFLHDQPDRDPGQDHARRKPEQNRTNRFQNLNDHTSFLFSIRNSNSGYFLRTMSHLRRKTSVSTPFVSSTMVLCSRLSTYWKSAT